MIIYCREKYLEIMQNINYWTYYSFLLLVKLQLISEQFYYFVHVNIFKVKYFEYIR